MFLRLTGLTIILALLTACGDDSAKESAPAVEKPVNILLRYKIDERGVDPYETTFVITNKFIRIDDDDNPRNFVLIDRKAEVVYSVADENDAILVVNKMPVDLEPPMEIKLSEQKVEEDNVPRIDGKEAIQYVFEANGLFCYQAVVAEGLLPEATKALQQYLGMLAGQHASTMKTVPADQITACDLSMHIFNPGRHLKHGLPVREWDGKSFRRQLIEYDNEYEVPEGIFELPEEFGRFTIQDMLGSAPELSESAAPK